MVPGMITGSLTIETSTIPGIEVGAVVPITIADGVAVATTTSVTVAALPAPEPVPSEPVATDVSTS